MLLKKFLNRNFIFIYICTIIVFYLKIYLFCFNRAEVIMGGLIIYTVYSYFTLEKYIESHEKILLTIIAGILTLYILTAIIQEEIIDILMVDSTLPLLLGAVAGYGIYKVKTTTTKIAVALLFSFITITYIIIFNR